MNNQYSRGCGYNYRRSAQRDISMERRSAEKRSMDGRRGENCPAEDRCMEKHSMNDCHMDNHSMEKSLAMGYVPMQVWSQPLPPGKGLQIGTIFSDLYKPFCGTGGVCR